MSRIKIVIIKSMGLAVNKESPGCLVTYLTYLEKPAPNKVLVG